ncbi:MAG TPA: intradiol ring-cleavage dioxygenase [Gemmatimonadaceae bacterium]|nr:intradiol ring-cleavage dioxygenase [Gemmatimonadaceae bacterium]
MAGARVFPSTTIALLYLFNHRHDDDHDDHGGLHRDLTATGSAMGRRDALRRFAFGAGALALFGCGDAGSGVLTGADTVIDTGGGSTTGGSTCTKIPSETAGPFPGDGSNGANVLNQTGVVRSDIRSSFAGLSGSAAGVPLTIRLTLVSASTCAVLAGRAVYLWHCDALGRYSLYTSGVTNQNYLRGVQAADASGVVTFTSIYPGCYAGRWPHIHFEVYPTLASSTSVVNKIATSQIALPKAANDLVYASSGYGNSASNASQISLASDGVFSDGAALELATVTGSVSSGLVASLTVAV